jgi:multiple sugar transport system substrate-binding protein
MNGSESSFYNKARKILPVFQIKTLFSVIALLIFQTSMDSAAADLRLVIWKSEAPRLWERAIADFEKQAPGVHVIREVGPSSSTQFHDLVTQKLKNRDTQMDVFLMDVIWPAEFASAGWALPLDRYFPVSEQKKFLAAPLSANRYHSRIFGVPLFVDAGLLYYRKDLLARYGFPPPRYWPEMVETAKKILARVRDPQLVGFSGQFKQYEGLVCDMMEYIMSNGGALWDPDRLVSRLQEQPAKEAVRFVRDQIVGEIGNQGLLAYQEPESLALFTQGKAVFHRNWPYAWKIANDPERSKIAGRVGMAVLPSFPGHPSVATLGGWQFGISRFSRNPELAWRFIEFMSRPEMQKTIALTTGRPPTRSALYDDPELLKRIPQLKSLLEDFKRAVPRPTTPVYIPLSNIMQRYFSSALAVPNSDINGRAALAARDMDRVLDLLRGHVAP